MYIHTTTHAAQTRRNSMEITETHSRPEHLNPFPPPFSLQLYDKFRLMSDRIRA